MSVIGIVGAGKLGLSLARALREKGQDVLVLTDHPVEDLRCLAKDRLPEFLSQCQKVVICLRESRIRPWAEAASATRVDLRKKVFVHTAGALSSDVLQSLRDKGAFCGVVHPAASFARPNPDVFKNASFGLSGHEEAKEFGKEIARILGCPSFEIRDHTLYHAGCVAAAGFVAAVLEVSLRILTRSSTAGQQQVLGLARSVIDNAARNGIEASITGPQVRGERQVVAEHLRALAACDPAVARLYNVLSDYIMKEKDSRGLSAELLKVLACPVCKGPVQHDPEHNRLICWNCKLAFEVKDGIPVMIPERAQEI